MKNTILFILKKREAYWGPVSQPGSSSGLSNSVRFVVTMLNSIGITANAVEVADNNDIDRVVTQFKPSHVIIEAFWVVPEKFDVLKPLHPTVTWIVRNHSEVPFLANEGIAFGWVAGYLARNVEVMCNAPRAVADMGTVARSLGFTDRLVTYGPNYYPIEEAGPVVVKPPAAGVVRVGCFGAIRPLKNQMAQAIAALAYATNERLTLQFAINGTRIEGNGDPILKNLRELFAANKTHILVEWPWLDHDAFVARIRAEIDIVLQASLSETFNIVAADAAAADVPVVVSPEVPWIGKYAHCEPLETRSIAAAMEKALVPSGLDMRIRRQRRDLSDYDTKSIAVWQARFS
jgi:hypothetical protein